MNSASHIYASQRSANRLATIFMATTFALVSHSVNATLVSVGLTYGPDQVNASHAAGVEEMMFDGVTKVAHAAGQVSTGSFLAYANSFNNKDAQANAQWQSIEFAYSDSLGSFEIAPDQVGMTFDAAYSRNAATAASGKHYFNIQLLAQVRDSTSSLVSFHRAWIIHQVDFTASTVSATTNDALSANGGYVDFTADSSGIAGTLYMPTMTLNPGDTLSLQGHMFTTARAKPIGGTDPSAYPWAVSDAGNTAQLFANVEPGLTSNAGVPLEWVTIVPEPTSLALLCIGALGLGFMRRRAAG